MSQSKIFLLKQQEIIHYLDKYLQECVVDDEDRWITREVLYRLMKELKEITE